MISKRNRQPLPKLSLRLICVEFGLNYNQVWQSFQLKEPPQVTSEQKEKIKAYIQDKDKALLKAFGIE